MTVNQTNYLNIGLMILSCGIAFIMPFELFLFSYAILGPLHYLTEISWLHKRQYFSPGKRDFILLGLFALVISFVNVFPYFYAMWGPKDINDVPILTDEMKGFLKWAQAYIGPLVFVAFASSALLIMARDPKRRVIGLILIAIVGYLFQSQKIVFFAFAVFLPTLVHVFVFTGAFILLGALKGRSTSGVISLFVFVACAVSLFVLFPDTITGPTAYGLQKYDAAFALYNRQIFEAFLHKQADSNDIYNTNIGIMITRFIAFAYTYHYLNWFSKTSVIKWHLVPRKSLIITLSIWVLSVALYFTDYRTGIMALYFLSYLHVIFEFPLNVRSFGDIGAELKLRLKPAVK
jgi:hypothetical protein